MKNDDYGYFGKGHEGYSHYMQTFDSIHKNSSNHTSKSDREKDNQTNNNEDISIGTKVYYAILYFIIFIGFIGLCSLLGNPGLGIATLIIAAVLLVITVVIRSIVAIIKYKE